jgi:hypothetical protein
MPVQTQMQVRRGTASSWTSTNPTLAAGELGFETDTGKFKIGTGSSTWTGLAYATGLNAITYLFNATAAQTTFSGVDANGLTLAYTVGTEQVFLNGALQVRGSDYTASNGTSIVLTSGALASDVLNVIAYSPMSVSDTYTQAQANALFIPDAIVDAKGDIVVASAADTPARLAVGANDLLLTAASSEATGLKYTGGYSTWTPTYTNFTLGNGTVTARYSQVGKTVRFSWEAVFGTTTAITGSFPEISLPITLSKGTCQMAARYLDAGTKVYSASYYITTSNIFYLIANVTNTTYLEESGINATTPFTWTAGDQILVSGIYEVA